MSDDQFLKVRGLKKYFDAGRPGLLSSTKNPRYVHAVDGVDFTLRRSEVLALVGESGCGKSTLSLLLMGLEDPTEGTITFEGNDITHLKDHERKELADLEVRLHYVPADPKDYMPTGLGNILRAGESALAPPIRLPSQCASFISLAVSCEASRVPSRDYARLRRHGAALHPASTREG